MKSHPFVVALTHEAQHRGQQAKVTSYINNSNPLVFSNTYTLIPGRSPLYKFLEIPFATYFCRKHQLLYSLTFIIYSVRPIIYQTLRLHLSLRHTGLHSHLKVFPLLYHKRLPLGTGSSVKTMDLFPYTTGLFLHPPIFTL